MSKKILILSASPRRGGNSDTLCERFLSGATEAGHQAEKIFLRDKTINYCTGCCECFGGKTCAQTDDMTEILGKMIMADVIVMATPIYFHTVNGQLKTLIDRCCPGFTEISGKEFYFFMTATQANRKIMEKALIELREFTGCLSNARERGVIYGTGVQNIGDILQSRTAYEAYEMGKTV